MSPLASMGSPLTEVFQHGETRQELDKTNHLNVIVIGVHLVGVHLSFGTLFNDNLTLSTGSTSDPYM